MAQVRTRNKVNYCKTRGARKWTNTCTVVHYLLLAECSFENE